MSTTPSRVTAVLLAGVTSATGIPATLPADTNTSTTYEITVETGMPHLEENLRYTTTHERRCTTLQTLFTAFPVLNGPALQGCQLKDPKNADDDQIVHVLACDGGHGTTGQAVWRTGANRMQGTLNVKLGGKNMTFYQRITAIPAGRCFR